MANHERRHTVALDDALAYWRLLDTRAQRPELRKLSNAISTLDLALSGDDASPLPVSLCADAWQRVRDSLFDTLVASFAGRFEITDHEGECVLPGEDWPASGQIEFYPDQMSRRNDSHGARLESLSPCISTVLRWAFAEGRQSVLPEDFEDKEETTDSEVDPDQAGELLERLYAVCEEQAHEMKKKAHRRWWQLYWEANSCPNKRQKHELCKQMVALEGIWGRPESA